MRAGLGHRPALWCPCVGLANGLLLGLVGIASVALTVGAIRLMPKLFSTRSSLAVNALAAGAACLAVFAPDAPSGWGVWDSLLRAGLAAVLTVAGSRARRSAWIVGAALAALGSVAQGLSWLALVSLGLAVGAAIAGRRRGASGRQGLVLGAVIGGATAEVLLRLGLHSPFGASALICAVAAGVLVFSALRQTPRRARRRARRVVIGLACAVLAVLGLGALALLHARGPSEQGLASASAGLAAAKSGAVSRSATDLQAAEADFSQADVSLSAWWAWPVRLVPVAAQNFAALRVLVAQGAAVAGAAADVAASQGGLGLTSGGGAVDTAGLVTGIGCGTGSPRL